MTDRSGRILKFVEKPKISPPGGAWINAGIYVLDRSVLENVPRDLPFDFSRNLIPLLLSQDVPIYGSRQSGFWFDIGTPATLREAEKHLKNAHVGSYAFAGQAASPHTGTAI
ncbi:NDP-sugar synthase, partial [Candidatus Sumerlaeota bacterium]|nr:NDP-sugar synthase [Candidatus Sumerlaeota bacterium]